MAVDLLSAVEPLPPPLAPFLLFVVVAAAATGIAGAAAGAASPASELSFLAVVVLAATSLAGAVDFCSEDLVADEVVAVAATVGNVEPAAELFASSSNESFVLAALEVFVAPFALLLLLLLGPPPAVFVIRGALWTDFTCGSRRRRRVTFC